jgi:hypothetical protein
MTGYMHPYYAESLAEFGIPRELRHAGGWILVRQIPGFHYYDAMGCYPLFACQEWSQLHADLEDLSSELISISLVTDPFGEYDLEYLRRCFKDLVIPFKEHFVVNLSYPMTDFVSFHHRRYAKKALKDVRVEVCYDPMCFIEDWIGLYSNLIERHGIKGIPAFSKLAFEKQLKVPGLIMLRATHKEATVGMTLWYIQRNIGYYHLGAYNAIGYKLHASFALFWFAIEHFAAKGLHWLNLGAGAGIKSRSTDGLSRFKQGWSTGTRIAYFCGRIFDYDKYSRITQAKGISAIDYFPAYRDREFV